MSIADNIRQQIVALDAEREQLSAALKILEASEPTPVAAKPVARRRRRSAATDAATKVVPLGKLLSVVSENPGTTTTTLAKMTGGDQSQLLALLKGAEADGKVRRDGERRATNWTAVTHEDKIQARATEIAKRSKAAA